MSDTVYSPLPQTPGRRFIRLCELQPGSGAEPLRIRLLPAELHKRATQEYEAISWVWGESASCTIIEYKGINLTIRQNLDDAMRAFRLPDRARLLWADALCINQGDPDEKAEQVAMMGLIYACAAKVLIWLGGDHEDVASNAFEEIKHHVESRQLAKSTPATWRVMSEEEVGRVDAKVWKSIGTFFGNEWFSRVWVQQELGMNQFATFFWGDSQISSKNIGAFYQWLTWNDYAGGTVVKGLLADSLYAAGSTFGLAATFRRKETSQGSPAFSFMQLLDYSQTLLATDPRDYVYAFLSHPSARNAAAAGDKVTDWDMVDTDSLLVVPDYKKTVDEVYSDIALALMRHHAELEPLTLVFHNESTLTSDAPSWVPRWHHKSATTPGAPVEKEQWRRRWDGLPPRTLGVFGKEFFDAGRGTPVETSVSPDHLTVKGVVFDRVSGAYDQPRLMLDSLWVASLIKSGQLSEIPQKLAGFLESKLKMMTSWLGNTPYEDPILAAALALTCGFVNGTSSKRAFNDLVTFRRNFAACCVEDAGVQNQLAHMGADEKASANPTDFISAINIFCFSRKFLHCDKGYFGLVPTVTKTGDYIAVFSGVAVPYVLRPVSRGHFKVVGHCYVQGIMGKCLQR